MLEHLKNLDRELFLFINSRHNSFFDTVMYWISDRNFWIPFYILLAAFLYKYYKKQTIVILVFIALSITLSDQLSASVIRPVFQRLRPSHEPLLQGMVHLSAAGAGGLYGFVSSHAANSFALLTFLSLILPRKFRPLKYILLIWAILIGYSRIYNGVHYPGDVLGGAFLGILVGWIVSRLYFRLNFNIEKPKR